MEIFPTYCFIRLIGHSSIVNTVAFSPNGIYLASGSDDRTIAVWSVYSGDCVKTLQGHSQPVITVVFSPDGEYLASGSKDNTICI